MSIYDDDDEGFGTPYPAARAKRRQASPLPRKNMTTREILEYCLDGYNEDMEPVRPRFRQTAIPDPELEFDGQDLYVKRNNVVQNSWPAMAGQPGYQNRASMSTSDLGPTPEGTYSVDPDELQKTLLWPERLQQFMNNPISSWRDITYPFYPTGKDSWLREPEKWGSHRVPLEPDQDTNTYGRHSMYIHGSDELGSNGCIDVGPNMEHLVPYIKSSRSPVKVRVRYKDEDFER